jgi:tape measure domain-containing protein
MSFNAGSITSTLGLDTDPFARGMLRAQGIMSVFPQSVTTFMANPLLGVLNLTREIGGAFTDMVKRGIASAAAMEQNSIAFEVMLGSAERAKKVLEDLTAFGAATPFELPGLVEASKSLIAMDTPAEELLDTISRLGDLAMGSEERLKSLAMVYGQVRMAGKLQGQDLNQFINAGVPLVRALAAELGQAQSEIKTLVSEGEIGFDDVRNAIRRLTNEGGAFAGMNQRMSQGLSGLYSTLKDAWNDMERQMGQAIITGGDGKSLLSEISKEIETLKPQIVEFGVALASAFKNALPYLRDTMNWAKDVLHMLGLVDRYKAAGSPLEGADKAGLVNNYAKSAEDLGRMQKLFNEQKAAAIKGFESASHLNSKGFAGGFGVGAIDAELAKDTERLVAEFKKNAELIDRESAMLDGMVNRAAAGEPIDQNQFDQVRQRLAELLQFADKFRELNARAQSGASISNLVPQHDVDLLQARGANIRTLIAQSTGEIDRLRTIERAAQAEAKDREQQWKAIVAAREADDAGRVAGKDVDAGTDAGKRGVDREAAERKQAAQRIEDLAFEAERTRLARELSASQARIAIFDLETKHRENRIEDIGELWEYQMLRIQQRELMMSEMAADAADEQRRIIEFDRETTERLAKIKGDRDPRVTQRQADEFSQQREQQRQAMLADIARREASPSQRAAGIGTEGIKALMMQGIAQAAGNMRSEVRSITNFISSPSSPAAAKPGTLGNSGTAAIESRLDGLTKAVETLHVTVRDQIGRKLVDAERSLESIDKKTFPMEGEDF